MSAAKTWALVGLLVLALIAGGLALRLFVFPGDAPGTAGASGPVPVELAAVERGPIERRREFTGSLEASAAFTVAPKVAGRVTRIFVNLADPVSRGQVVAELDDAELREAEAQARADLAVAQARVSAAEKMLELARRNYDRVAGLRGRDISSEQDLDGARSEKTAAEASLEVTRAEVTRAKAAHKAAQIRRAYASVVADWSTGDEQRVVGARFVNEGAMLAANAPLLSIVDLDPLIAVVFVTEVDYAELAPGMAVELRTDAFPGQTFAGSISRIAPVFRVESRQARVEITVPNPDARLKPGMFVRARAVLERLADATIVPESALVERGGETVVFVVEGEGEGKGDAVRLRAVEVGVREGERVAVRARDDQPINGRVVTLGQQQLVDGSPVVVPQRGGGDR